MTVRADLMGTAWHGTWCGADASRESGRGMLPGCCRRRGPTGGSPRRTCSWTWPTCSCSAARSSSGRSTPGPSSAPPRPADGRPPGGGLRRPVRGRPRRDRGLPHRPGRGGDGRPAPRRAAPGTTRSRPVSGSGSGTSSSALAGVACALRRVLAQDRGRARRDGDARLHPPPAGPAHHARPPPPRLRGGLLPGHGPAPHATPG